jgi:ParB-like chromosome segregation protein Spo0J
MMELTPLSDANVWAPLSSTNVWTPPPVVEIPLGSLVPNPAHQPRGLGAPPGDDLDDSEKWQANLNPHHLESLRTSQQEKWPPLLVTPSERQPEHYDLLDGFHRYAVAVEHAQADWLDLWPKITIPCRIIAHGGVEISIMANIRHGLPLSRADRKAAACLFHQGDPTLSYRQIAAKVGLSDKTVKSALERELRAEFPELDEGQDASAARTYDSIKKLVRLAVAASKEHSGTDGLAKLFSSKTDREEQVGYVAYLIWEYPERDQVQIAHGITVMGQVLIDGSKQSLSASD